jgi:hypothetical protein
VCKAVPVVLSATPANGYSAVWYQWRRNGADLINGPAGASIGGGTVSGAFGVCPSPTDGTAAVLTITDPRASDSGDYTIVFATDDCGEAESQPAAVSVCRADYNCDGFVDGIDYDQFNNDFESTDPVQQMNADYNSDGFVDGIDYDLFNNDFEVGCG